MHRHSLLPGKFKIPGPGSARSCQRIDLRDDCLSGDEVCRNTALAYWAKTDAATIDLFDRDHRTRVPGRIANRPPGTKVCNAEVIHRFRSAVRPQPGLVTAHNGFAADVSLREAT